MEVDYTALVQARPDLKTSAQEASALLESQIGPSASLVRASWDVSRDDRGRTLVGLEISDWTGSVGYRFSPEELSEVDHMKSRLHRLWGDLLMIQIHSHLDSLNWELRKVEEL